MKVIIVFSICSFILFIQSCDLTETVFVSKWTNGKQMVPGNDTILPDSIKAYLWEDAARIALRDVHSDPESRQNLIVLPDELVELYYNGFVHIYGAQSLAARDSVFKIYKIHTFRRPEQHSIIITVDSTKSWITNWRMGQRLTGNLYVDSLMNKYNLQLVIYYSWPLLHAAVLESAAPINIYALGKKFQTIDGVIFAEENRTIGDGNDVNAKIEDEHLSIEYSIGWGDCPAGCMNRHYWLFNVRYDGTVSFVSSYGDPIF